MLSSILDAVPYCLSCSVGTFIVFDFMKNMYSKRYKDLIYVVSEITFGILWFLVCLLKYPILNFSYLFILSIIIGLSLYKENNLKKVIQITLLVLLYAGLDALIAIIISIITGGSIPLYDKDPVLLLLDVFLLQIIMLLFYKFIIIILKKQENYSVYLRQFIILVIFLLINVVVIYFLTVMAANSKLDQKSIHLIMMLMTLLSAILNLSVIYFFEYISKSTLLQKKIELMQQKVDMQYNYYQQLEIEYNKSQKIMHDVKNHIAIVNQLYQTKHFDKGLEYTSKLSSIINELGLKFNCNNKILNIIINENIRRCELNRIKFFYSVENLDLSFIDDIDLTAIFANLFDNAIEACEKVNESDRKIELRLYKFNNMLIINLLNSFDNPIIRRNERFMSNKVGHKAIGLSNVKQAVDKYDGDLNIDIDQGKFSVSIMFPILN